MVARNIGIGSKWRGPFVPKSKAGKAAVLVDRIEHHPVALRWSGLHGMQTDLALHG